MSVLRPPTTISHIRLDLEFQLDAHMSHYTPCPIHPLGSEGPVQNHKSPALHSFMIFPSLRFRLKYHSSQDATSPSKYQFTYGLS